MFLTPLYLKPKRTQIYWIAFFYLVSSGLHSEIITDGTAGSAQTLTGPDFTISEDLGTRAGNNLFHSFEHFNIATGEQAIFTGSDTISNVISRVTGGETSIINGRLRSEVGQADFYFINPAGVVFGAGAQIDVPASFYVSTADELRFTDNITYSASTLPVSTWSIGTPESFGFLSNQTASIHVADSELVLTPGSTLALSAGKLNIDNVHLSAEQGEIQLTATGDTATIITKVGILSEIAQGTMNINNSIIDVSGESVGRILIQSGANQFIGSKIFANGRDVTGANSEQGINIHATSLQIENSQVTTGTLDQDLIKAGNLIIQVDGKLSIVRGGIVSSITSTKASSGNILVHAGELLIDNYENKTTGILNGTESGTGPAGITTLTIDSTLSILHGGTIRSNSLNSTLIVGFLDEDILPGKIEITAQTINLSDSFITTKNFNGFHASPINLAATDSLHLNSSTISTEANNAKGGSITTQAQIIDLQNSRITSSADKQGNGGDISLTANVLILETGFIRANTEGTNTLGGNIQINTDALIASRNNLQKGGDSSRVFEPYSGNNVIQAAAPDGISGIIDITSPQLNISGDLANLKPDLLDIGQVAQNPCITPGAKQSTLVRLGQGGLPESPEQAGNITLDAGRLQQLLPHLQSMSNGSSGTSNPQQVQQLVWQTITEC